MIFASSNLALNFSVKAADGSNSNNSCYFLLSSTPYGEIHPWFKHDSSYDVEVKNFTIKNQCSTGHCHMYAWASELEIKSGIEISNTYLDAMNIYNVAVESLTNSLTSIKFGTLSLTDSGKRIADIGIIPASAWRGHDQFIKSKIYNRLVTSIESIIVNYIELIKDAPLEQRPAKFFEFKAIIFDLINQMAGPFPDKFEYDGQIYSPKGFAASYFPELQLPLIQLTVDSKNHGATSEVDRIDRNTLKISTSRHTTEQILKRVLDSGRAVYFAYTHEGQYVDEDTGIMSIEAFSYPPMAKILSRELMNVHHKWKGNHAVLIVGYKMDAKNEKVIKWKIRNSWGDKSGDQGFFHMYQDYMNLFGWGFSFVNDGSVDISDLL